MCSGRSAPPFAPPGVVLFSHRETLRGCLQPFYSRVRSSLRSSCHQLILRIARAARLSSIIVALERVMEKSCWALRGRQALLKKRAPSRRHHSPRRRATTGRLDGAGPGASSTSRARLEAGRLGPRRHDLLLLLPQLREQDVSRDAARYRQSITDRFSQSAEAAADGYLATRPMAMGPALTQTDREHFNGSLPPPKHRFLARRA
jgi:hypothetical protein